MPDGTPIIRDVVSTPTPHVEGLPPALPTPLHEGAPIVIDTLIDPPPSTDSDWLF